MSGGISQLVAIGAQDAHIVGQPEVSFFRSTYKRHTNFSQTVERQVIQGNVSNNGMSTVRFERKGDLLGYVYLTPLAADGASVDAIAPSAWKTLISKVELLIGGQVIDEQDNTFIQHIAPSVMAAGTSKSVSGDLFGGSGATKFYPLRFTFCENWQSALPLVGLQYHDVELRITWGESAKSNRWECYANYVYLDSEERQMFASQPQNMIITQVQKAIPSGARIQELNFNHPIKMLVAAVEDGSTVSILNNSNRLKLQINGTDVSDYKFADPGFSTIPAYYHSSSMSRAVSGNKRLFLYPFCLDVSKLQPTGSLNFSRLDSARIVNESALSNETMYAVNYNILRIENGMGGLMYSN